MNALTKVIDLINQMDKNVQKDVEPFIRQMKRKMFMNDILSEQTNIDEGIIRG